jgi:DNA-damage-inducible protein J
MAKSANMYIRIDPEVKADVEAIYSQYGMSVTEAINIFLYQSRNVGGLPFDLRPNADTLESMRDGNKIIRSGRGRFNDADALLKELKV